MIKFSDYLDQDLEVNEEELVESVEWEDIEDTYTAEDFIEVLDEEYLDEKLSVTARIKKGQKLKSRKTAFAQARKMKLRRTSNPEVIGKRAKIAARRSIIKKLLKGRDKSKLSAQEKDRLEKQATMIMSNQKGLVVRMIPKVRQLERQRLQAKAPK